MQYYYPNIIDLPGEELTELNELKKINNRHVEKIRMLEKQIKILKTSNARFVSTIKNLHFGILIENSSRKIELVNQHFCDLFGIPGKPHALYGADCAEMADVFKSYFKQPEAFIDGVEKILLSGKRVLAEPVELSNGKTFARCYVPLFENKYPAGHLWIYQDITEREKSEEALQKQKDFYETILNSLPSDIAVFDKDHRYLFVNPIGIKDDELRRWIIGKNDYDYCRLKNKPKSIAKGRSNLFQRVNDEKREVEWEETLIKDGTEDYYIRRMTPILDDNNEVKYIIGYGLNITERKIIEQAIVKAKEDSERSAKTKETFLANMSHEIRTPMNGILGLTSLLIKSKVTPQQKEHLRLIQNSAQDLLGLINEILDLEKISNNKVVLEKIEFQPENKINDILQIFSFAAKDKGVKLVFRNKLPDNFMVIGDPTRFVQILNNLVSNAVKFTNRGSITITAGAALKNKNKCTVSMEVKDSGIGISSKRIDKLFVPFTQAEAEITRKYGGSGLGLSITKKLVEMHNGTVWVESEINKGSKFSFNLEYDCYQSKTTEINKEKNIVKFKPLGKVNLLLAEDNEINQILAQTIIGSWGVNVLTASNGLEALKLLKENDVDIVFMDIQMPVMNGIEATEAIRNLTDPVKAATPVIAVTANAIKGTETKYFSAGMNDYITKPYTDVDLYNAIKRNLTKEKTAGKTSTRIKKGPLKMKKSVPLYDLSEIKEISNGNDKIIEDLIQIFKNTAPKTLKELNEFYTEGNMEGVSAIAHKLKSTVHTLKINSLSAIVNVLEHREKAKKGYDKNMMAKDIETVNIVINKVLDTIEY